MRWIIKKTEAKLRLDTKDQKLLDSLLMNARISLKAVAKKLRISKPAVLKRIQKLEEKNIIQGYSCFINFNSLGMKTFQVGIKVNMSLEQKEKYLLRLTKCENINQILSLSGGQWDFLCRIICFEKEIIATLDQMMNSQVQRMEILQTYVGFFKKEGEIHSIISKEEKLTKEEIFLLRELATGGKVRFSTLAEKTKISYPTIRKTIKRLEEKNILLAHVTKINPLIYGTQGFILVITTKTRAIEKKISKALAKVKSTGTLCNIQFPNIISFHLIESLKDMKVVEKVLEPFMDQIMSYEFIEIVEQRKYEYFPKAVETILKERNRK